jgi:hypothetical protein
MSNDASASDLRVHQHEHGELNGQLSLSPAGHRRATPQENPFRSSGMETPPGDKADMRSRKNGDPTSATLTSIAGWRRLEPGTYSLELTNDLP